MHTPIETLATDGNTRSGSPIDDHVFCAKCGFCDDCKDCAVFGCGSQESDDESN